MPIPELLHFLQRRGLWRPALGANGRFDAVKPPHKLRVGVAQGGLRIDAQMARDIRHHEEQIAELLGHLVRSAGLPLVVSERRLQLANFLFRLGEHRRKRRPIKSNLRCTAKTRAGRASG
jgi:hypothetical protein